VNYEALRFWFGIVQFILTAGVWVYVWLSNRQRATTKRVQDLEKLTLERLQEHDGWLNRLDTKLKYIPTRDDHSKLSDRIEDLHGDLHEISGVLSGLRRAVDLMNEHLLNRSDKG